MDRLMWARTGHYNTMCYVYHTTECKEKKRDWRLTALIKGKGFWWEGIDVQRYLTEFSFFFTLNDDNLFGILSN